MGPLDEFEASAERFGLLAVEQNIGSWSRGYAEASRAEWHFSENVAMRVLLDLAIHDPTDPYPADGTSDRQVNILARALGNCFRSADYDTTNLAGMTALVYAGAGNFPSSSIFAKRAQASSTGLGSTGRWMMNFLADPKRGLAQAQPPGVLANYARGMGTALRTGLGRDFDQASRAFQVACEQANEQILGADRYLLLLWTHVHERLRELSVARALVAIGFPESGYLSTLVGTVSPLFFPPQAEAVRNPILTRPDGHVLVSLPTSTGKSLIGEIALVSSLYWQPGERWLAVYIAPYRALADQIHSRMRSRLRQINVACVKRRGNYLTDMLSIGQRRPTVLIATPEAFDALLRQQPDLYTCLSACVFDEFHLVEQHQRGLRYEGLLGRFLHGAAGESWPKIIALSAVVTDVTGVRQWLGIEDAGFFSSGWKPTGRRIAITSPIGSVNFFAPGEQASGATISEPAWRGQIDLPHEVYIAPTRPKDKTGWGRYNREVEQYGKQIRENVVVVALDQLQRFREPVLVVASSRVETRLIASEISKKLNPRSKANPANDVALVLGQRYPHLFTLRECLPRRVAYHNASLPDWVGRELVRLMELKELDVVVATTTLAEGVDLPFRVVVMADWRFWMFGQNRPMPTLLFHNIAGRCGRAGEFSEGDTIIVDNPGREEGGFGDRLKDYMRLYITPRPFALRSSVESTLDSGDQEIRLDTRGVLESQFVAYVDACGGKEEIETEYARSLYAAQAPDSVEYVEEATLAFTEDMVAEDRYPVLERLSPLRLTDFGQVSLRTGLSPRSCVALAEFLDAFEGYQAPPKGSRIRARHQIQWEPLLIDMWGKVKGAPWVRELEGFVLQKHIRGRRHPVTETNFPDVLLAWVSGVPIETMAFLTLRETAKKGQAKAWLKRETHNQYLWLEEWIEKLAIFCDTYLGNQWSWACRGAALIGRHLQKVDLAEDLERLAIQLNFGVSQLEAKELLAEGCPLDRAKLDWIIREYKRCTGERELDIRPFRAWLHDSAASLPESQVGLFERVRISETDFSALTEFVGSKAAEPLPS